MWCGWGVGTCLQLTHAALSPLDRERKTELGKVKVHRAGGEFFEDKNTAGEQPRALRLRLEATTASGL